MSSAPDGKRDFFVSYTSGDEPWAEWLAWTAEEAKWSVWLQKWDFRGSFVHQMDRSNDLSDRTIGILSAGALDSTQVQAEWDARRAVDPRNEKESLILIKVGPCEVPGLLKPFIWLDLTGTDPDTAKARLVDCLRRQRRKPGEAPPFPSGPSREKPTRQPRFPTATHDLPPGESDGSAWTISSDHQRRTAKLLCEDPLFLQTLKDEFPEYFDSTQVPENAAEMVHFFAQCEAEQVQSLFYLVCRALWLMEDKALEIARRRQSEKAAAYLYCLAACRLVDQAAHQARVSECGVDRYIVFVPTDENVVCAIIATALFGGELRLVPGEKQGLPRAECLFEVKAPEGSDQIASDFEVAAYIAVFSNNGQVTDMSLERGSGRTLTTDQREWLKTRIKHLKNAKRLSFSFLVRGLEPREAQSFAKASQRFTTTYQVPVMVHESGVTSQLLGMEVGALRAEIREFWCSMADDSASDAPSTHQPRPSPQEVQ